MTQNQASYQLPPTPDAGVPVEIGPYKGFLKYSNYTLSRAGALPELPDSNNLNYNFVLHYLWCMMDPKLFSHFIGPWPDGSKERPERLAQYIDTDVEVWGSYLELIHECFVAQGIGEDPDEEKKSKKKPSETPGPSTVTA